MLEMAFLVRALRHRPCLQEFFDQVAAAAIGALLENGFAPSNEVALGITVAAEKRSPTFRAPFHHFPFRAVRARDADCLLLNELAFRIVAACDEFTVAPVLLHQVVSATGAFLFERYILALLAANLLGGFTFRITGTSEERSKAAFFENHRATAVLTIFLLVLLTQIAP